MKRIDILRPVAALLLAGAVCASRAEAQQPNKGQQPHQQPSQQPHQQPQPQARPQPPTQRAPQHARPAQPQPRPMPARPPQPRMRPPRPVAPAPRMAPPPRRVAPPPARVSPTPRRGAPARVVPPARVVTPSPGRVVAPRARLAPPPGRVVGPPPPPRHAAEARQRDARYRVRIAREIGVGQARGALLERAHRPSQLALEERYEAQLRRQQARLRFQPDYAAEPAFLAPPIYYYRLHDEYYEANAFGANLLQKAIEWGYQEGFQAGQADRYDHYRFDFRDNYIYQDADYGYQGYVSEPDYSYYFREGFRRGYEDGYYSRYRYGTMYNGQPSILAGVLNAVLGLIPIR